MAIHHDPETSVYPTVRPSVLRGNSQQTRPQRRTVSFSRIVQDDSRPLAAPPGERTHPRGCLHPTSSASGSLSLSADESLVRRRKKNRQWDHCRNIQCQVCRKDIAGWVSDTGEEAKKGMLDPEAPPEMSPLCELTFDEGDEEAAVEREEKTLRDEGGSVGEGFGDQLRVEAETTSSGSRIVPEAAKHKLASEKSSAYKLNPLAETQMRANGHFRYGVDGGKMTCRENKESGIGQLVFILSLASLLFAAIMGILIHDIMNLLG